MMTNIKIELTDEQRAKLQRQLTGRRALITRKELTAFVTGIVHGALDCEAVIESPPVPCFTPDSGLVKIPDRYIEKHGYPQDHPFWQGWLRGWNQVAGNVKLADLN